MGKLEKFIVEQEKIDPKKIKKIENEKIIQGPIDRKKINKIEKEKEQKNRMI